MTLFPVAERSRMASPLQPRPTPAPAGPVWSSAAPYQPALWLLVASVAVPFGLLTWADQLADRGTADRLTRLAGPSLGVTLAAGLLLATRVRASAADRQEQLRLIQAQQRELERAYADMARLARHDPLTGLVNRRGLDERLADELARAARQDAPLAVLLADLDHFKRLNDDLGHPAGDRTLKAVAAALRAAVREIDTVARYGGEEFCILLPGADADAGRAAAERVRRAVAACDPPDRSVTVSVGVAVWSPDAATGAELLAAADRALYRAKANGRNRVAGAAPPVPAGV